MSVIQEHVPSVLLQFVYEVLQIPNEILERPIIPRGQRPKVIFEVGLTVLLDPKEPQEDIALNV